MPIPNYASYYNDLKNGVGVNSQAYVFTGTGVSSRLGNLWALGLPANSAPTTARALGATASNVAFTFPTTPTGTKRLKLLGGSVNPASTCGMWMVVDLLSHQGGLSGAVATPQTTNLPTTALGRYTTGVGVMMAFTIYTQIGSTATLATVVYTNQNGTGSKTSRPVVIGGTGWREVTRMIPIGLAYGDTGVRSVESVTLQATTGTAGAFGVTLFKPLAMFAADEFSRHNDGDFVTGRFIGGIPDVTGACLCLVSLASGSAIASCMRVQVAESDD